MQWLKLMLVAVILTQLKLWAELRATTFWFGCEESAVTGLELRTAHTNPAGVHTQDIIPFALVASTSGTVYYGTHKENLKSHYLICTLVIL